MFGPQLQNSTGCHSNGTTQTGRWLQCTCHRWYQCRCWSMSDAENLLLPAHLKGLLIFQPAAWKWSAIHRHTGAVAGLPRCRSVTQKELWCLTYISNRFCLPACCCFRSPAKKAEVRTILIHTDTLCYWRWKWGITPRCGLDTTNWCNSALILNIHIGLLGRCRILSAPRDD